MNLIDEIAHLLDKAQVKYERGHTCVGDAQIVVKNPKGERLCDVIEWRDFFTNEPVLEYANKSLRVSWVSVKEAVSRLTKAYRKTRANH